MFFIFVLCMNTFVHTRSYCSLMHTCVENMPHMCCKHRLYVVMYRRTYMSDISPHTEYLLQLPLPMWNRYMYICINMYTHREMCVFCCWYILYIYVLYIYTRTSLRVCIHIYTCIQISSPITYLLLLLLLHVYLCIAHIKMCLCCCCFC